MIFLFFEIFMSYRPTKEVGVLLAHSNFLCEEMACCTVGSSGREKLVDEVPIQFSTELIPLYDGLSGFA